ncbi:unnamed protein product [Cuscuta campestris]|uniref:Uncharacterized protein n=1 Tax=Cuscuta campestris TaxID=132261 RepID=A0A484L4M1_9ASTE|nr:unnamed protein product [Cuscuta campestris]
MKKKMKLKKLELEEDCPPLAGAFAAAGSRLQAVRHRLLPPLVRGFNLSCRGLEPRLSASYFPLLWSFDSSPIYSKNRISVGDLNEGRDFRPNVGALIWSGSSITVEEEVEEERTADISFHSCVKLRKEGESLGLLVGSRIDHFVLIEITNKKLLARSILGYILLLYSVPK